MNLDVPFALLVVSVSVALAAVGVIELLRRIIQLVGTHDDK